MTWMIARLIGLGVPARLAKPLLAVVGLVLVIGALWALRACDKRNIIADYTAGSEAKNAKADRKADAKAADERRADDARAVTESQEIKEAINEARQTGADPRAAYYACLVRLQAARRDGLPPPSC